MDGVDLAGRHEVAQAEQRRDRQEGLDTRRALAHDAAGLEAVHPAHELPADEQDGQQEAGLDEVARPLDAPPARAQGGALQDVGGGDGVQPDEGAGLARGPRGRAGRGAARRIEPNLPPGPAGAA